MTRSLGDPRPTEAPISPEDRRTLALVRREVWTNGFYGFIQGSVGALLLHTVGSFVETNYYKHKAGVYYVKKFNRNTALASFFLGGALGSFLMATMAGKNEVHNLHPIYNRKPDEREEELEERKRNRVLRRETLEKQMEPGHGGLSDAHGGHWDHDFDSDFEKQNNENNDDQA